jgi:hypothetical protein
VEELEELARYIVLNPVRARRVRTAKNWRWSGCRATIGSDPPQAGLNTDGLLSCFAKRRLTAIKRYKGFIAEGKNQPSPWERLRNQVFLGDEKFVDEVRKHLPPDTDLSEIPKSQKRPAAIPLMHYSNNARNRDEAIHEAYQSGGYSMKQIGDHFDLHYSTISRIIRDKEQDAKVKP